MTQQQQHHGPVGGWMDLWQVKICGVERLMTPGDLRCALARGEMDGRTAVRRPGTSGWLTLADATASTQPPLPSAPASLPVPAAPKKTEDAPKESRARVLALFVVCIAAASYVLFYDDKQAATAPPPPPPAVSVTTASAAPAPPAVPVLLTATAESAPAPPASLPKRKKTKGRRSDAK